ncbi:hypothetical protein QUB80_24275 [Chlorogloeopsis sp. ULAP01]|uniref:hypothetical protein n=1 Tax=Chlorogloeopsis sp. ULAP01 TaxID=3056483 RepID=UPI0025AAD3F9|nr:hypothetical protein [Chlorogloeopsis sp. ULAP01]MDM9383805.1 hypothetical protein [Chlorogloeopsis sp. ULAP01]
MAIETSIWIYWLLCLLATILIVANRNFVDKLLSPYSKSFYLDKGYTTFLILGWITTFMASSVYILFTRKYEIGTYEISDLLLFSVMNGVLEQFMFIFWFLLGCYLGHIIVSKNHKLIFLFGYISYFIFSGLIHALFWTKVLPLHQPATVVMISALTTMSLIWMWLAWRYRAVVAIIAMHILIDFLMIGHLHFTWFDSLQLI